MQEEIILTQFAQDILKGLSANKKFLSSKYFYDDKGSRIFQQIMQMPEYYLTDCELEIFKTQKQEIFNAITKKDTHYELIELGAGDGLKTKILLSHFLSQQCDFEYIPIDISGKAVNNLVHDLKNELPSLKTHGKVGDYFKLIDEINQTDGIRKILLFLGSNIGNYSESETLDFLGKLKSVMQSGDMILIGFDLKKNPATILKAYNDPQGYTAAFNLNLLSRINRELNANFEVNSFKHQEVYDPENGKAESFLISLQKQKVEIRNLGEIISFEKDERIFMEISQKYDDEMISDLAKKSGFKIVRNFYDQRLFYTNSLWTLK